MAADDRAARRSAYDRDMDMLTVVLAILGGLFALWLLAAVVAVIQSHRSDDREMDALWFAVSPVLWLLRQIQGPRGGPRP